MKSFIAFLSLALAACAQMRPEVSLMPDGKQVYNVKCSDSAYSIGSCYEQARKICGSAGFQTLGNKEAGGVLTMAFSCRS
jgi:hypothetical protein